MIVGYASLLNLEEHGEPARSLDDLFDTGLLYVTAEGYIGMAGFGLSVPQSYIRRVRVSFPDNSEDFAMQAGFVRAKDTGEKLTCVWFDDHEANDRDWAYLWFRLADGETTGDDMLDRLIEERRLARGQPTTAPTGD